jgi:nitrogen-specific signal transduction histidine kinase
MEEKHNTIKEHHLLPGADFVDHFWEKSWVYIKTVVDVVREPILILDKNLYVMAANESFYRTFQVNKEDTEGKLVYELGNGQWDISALRKLLEHILPQNTFFNGFEVSHEFPHIGHKTIILNARQIHVEGDLVFPPIILLAMEDITNMMAVAETIAGHAKQVEMMLTKRTNVLEDHIEKLEKEINRIKRTV